MAQKTWKKTEAQNISNRKNDDGKKYMKIKQRVDKNRKENEKKREQQHRQ